MKIQMKCDYGITAELRTWLPKGEEVEVDDKLALMLIQSGRALPVAEKPTDKGEKAVAPKAERRTRNSK